MERYNALEVRAAAAEGALNEMGYSYRSGD